MTYVDAWKRGIRFANALVSLGVGPGDRVAVLEPNGIAFSHRVGPISHCSGYLFVPTWLAGGCNILEGRFDAKRVVELMTEVGGYSFGVPTMVADLVDAGRAAALGPASFERLEAFVVSGAPIRATTALADRDLLGPKLYQRGDPRIPSGARHRWRSSCGTRPSERAGPWRRCSAASPARATALPAEDHGTRYSMAFFAQANRDAVIQGPAGKYRPSPPPTICGSASAPTSGPQPHPQSRPRPASRRMAAPPDHDLLARSVHRTLREQILTGEHGPGTSLSVTALAARLDVSRGPVREAVQQLVYEGIAVHVPDAGARVAVLDDEAVSTVLEVREVLDGLAAQRAARRITDVQLSTLTAMVDRRRELLGTPADEQRDARLDLEFHTGLAVRLGRS